VRELEASLAERKTGSMRQVFVSQERHVIIVHISPKSQKRFFLRKTVQSKN
jgi:hypothetical protein